MQEQTMDILERIHASYYQLTATERKVADFVLLHHEQVQFMSITQLADECGTADATISRFCRRLDLKGFNAFKLELARHAVTAGAPSVYVSPQEHDFATPEGRAREVGRLNQEAVSQTIELANNQAVQRAVALFENAGKVLSMGAGGSMIMAEEFAHVFSTVSGKFFSVADSHLQMSAAATMNPGDVVVLLSYSGATTNGLQILELAKSKGVSTVLVTRYPKSPAAKMADVVLLCGSNESPVQQGSVRAKVAQLVVMDLLYQEYCHRNRDTCEENLQSIAAALTGMHL
ncbi:MAG: MurR/RpiR family transcriptional regulator [Oscillospiraceae bacterium]|nr:MurR/RpiR family transcriptional regulator [Oscillospiraceae bacterium]